MSEISPVRLDERFAIRAGLLMKSAVWLFIAIKYMFDNWQCRVNGDLEMLQENSKNNLGDSVALRYRIIE